MHLHLPVGCYSDHNFTADGTVAVKPLKIISTQDCATGPDMQLCGGGYFSYSPVLNY